MNPPFRRTSLPDFPLPFAGASPILSRVEPLAYLALGIVLGGGLLWRCDFKFVDQTSLEKHVLKTFTELARTDTDSSL